MQRVVIPFCTSPELNDGDDSTTTIDDETEDDEGAAVEIRRLLFNKEQASQYDAIWNQLNNWFQWAGMHGEHDDSTLTHDLQTEIAQMLPTVSTLSDVSWREDPEAIDLDDIRGARDHCVRCSHRLDIVTNPDTSPVWSRYIDLVEPITHLRKKCNDVILGLAVGQ